MITCTADQPAKVLTTLSLHSIRFAGVARGTQRNVLLTELVLYNKRIFLRSSEIGEKQRPRYGEEEQNLMLSISKCAPSLKLSETS